MVLIKYTFLKRCLKYFAEYLIINTLLPIRYDIRKEVINLSTRNKSQTQSDILKQIHVLCCLKPSESRFLQTPNRTKPACVIIITDSSYACCHSYSAYILSFGLDNERAFLDM